LLTLSKLGLEAGLEFKAIEAVLKSDVYAKERDILEAQSIGVQGVPFCFDNKYAVSGAPRRNFRKNFRKVWEEGKFISKPTLLPTTDADSCGPDGCN
jgi:protein disulfide-isomerase